MKCKNVSITFILSLHIRIPTDIDRKGEEKTNRRRHFKIVERMNTWRRDFGKKEMRGGEWDRFGCRFIYQFYEVNTNEMTCSSS